MGVGARMDAHYRSFEKLVLPELLRQQIDVLGMKAMAYGILLRSNIVIPAAQAEPFRLRVAQEALDAGIPTEDSTIESHHKEGDVGDVLHD